MLGPNPVGRSTQADSGQLDSQTRQSLIRQCRRILSATGEVRRHLAGLATSPTDAVAKREDRGIFGKE
jgi:hypothetical protein